MSPFLCMVADFFSIRFATLRPFGNPKSADNWDVFKTPQIKVLGKYNKTG